LLTRMLLILPLVMMTSLSKEEEVDIWAYTQDYIMIIVEGSDLEPLYGIQNKHTYVIEVQEPVFSNAVGYMIDLQEAFDAVSEIIDEDGGVIDDMKVVFKSKKEVVH